MDSNLPDNCQGSGTYLPWNEPEQEVYGCWHCGDEVKSEDDLQEVKTKTSGYQFIGDCCIDEYISSTSDHEKSMLIGGSYE